MNLPNAKNAVTSWRRAVVLLAGVLAALAAPLSSAQVTYSYAGNNFTTFQYGEPPEGSYTTAMRVTGSFQVASAFTPFVGYNITPLSYSFTDGRNVFSSASPVGTAYFELVADASGQIFFWNIQLRYEPTPGNVSQIMTDIGQDSGVIAVTIDGNSSFDTAWVNSQPGSWSVAVSPVPEPETYAMLLAGLGLLGFAARRRKVKETVAA